MLPNANFIRTTDEKHIESANAFWKECEKNGDIYKKNYKIKCTAILLKVIFIKIFIK